MSEGLRRAHRHSANHREELDSSEFCGCFYCLRTFPTSKISEWVDDETTALCPYCGVDSVIGSASSFPITREFLEAMRAVWFHLH